MRAGALQKVQELGPLARLVRQARPHTVLEIGSFLGGTLALWTKVAADDALLVSVDLPGEYGSASVADLESLARRSQRVAVVRADSQLESTRDDVRRALGGRAVDFLMIDGDHSYDGVRRDFELYGPLVRDGGLVAFHDITPHTERPDIQVDRFWAELRGRYESVEYVVPGREFGQGPWGGIGVLWYREGVKTAGPLK